MRVRIAARLPFWVLLGALTGVLAGLTFGDRMATLQPIGVVYAMLLESVVYPYILSSSGWGVWQARAHASCCAQAG